MAKVRSLGCNPPPFRHSSSCRRDCFRPKAYCHSDCLTMIHSHKIAPKLNLGNHSSWGNGPWATIPPRGMVPFGTSWASRLTFLVQTLISLVRLVPKMFTKVHILVPKRTIPLGGKYTYTHIFFSFSKFSLSEPCRFLFLFQNSICPVTKSRRVEKLIHNCFNGCQNVSILASK